MPIKNPRELFVTLLSHLRVGTERSAALYADSGEVDQGSGVKAISIPAIPIR